METEPSFVAYIDEAGDDGTKFGLGSSKWFIVSAALSLKKDERCFVSIVDTVKQAINQAQDPRYPRNPDKPLHFKDLRHEQKKFYTSEIAKHAISAKSIIIGKQQFLTGQSLIAYQNLYSYAIGELIKQVLLWCAEQKDENTAGDKTVQLVFSKRTTLSYDFLISYLDGLFATNPDLAQLKADHFRTERVIVLSHGKHAGLQVADAIASSHFNYIEVNLYGQTERTYLINLASVLSKRKKLIDAIVVIPTVEDGAIVLPDMKVEHDLLQELKEKAATGTKDPTVDQTVAARNPDEPEGDLR